MPAIRTHTGRGRLLAAVLWSSTYALLGCTDGISEPIYSASKAAQNPAGHGAAGRGIAGHNSAGRGGAVGQQLTGGSRGAADGGDGHADGGNPVFICDTGPWSPAAAGEELDLLGLLNSSIEGRAQCADRTFARKQFPMMDDALHCSARKQASSFATWGRPGPPGSGPGHDPFYSTTMLVTMGSTAYSARTELLSDSMACDELTSPKYTRVGIGFAASSWVILLAPE